MCERQEEAYHQGWGDGEEKRAWEVAHSRAWSLSERWDFSARWMKARTGTQGPALQESPHFKKEKKSEMRKNGRGGMRAWTEEWIPLKGRRPGCSVGPGAWQLRKGLWVVSEEVIRPKGQPQSTSTDVGGEQDANLQCQ